MTAVGLLMLLETADFLDRAIPATGVVQYPLQDRLLVDYRTPNGDAGSAWVSRPWWAAFSYGRGDQVAFWLDLTLVDYEWLPFIGAIRPSARLASWVSLWLSGLLVSGFGVGVIVLAIISARSSGRFPAQVTLDPRSLR